MIILENILSQKISDDMESVVTGGIFPWYLSRDISRNKIEEKNNYAIFVDKNTINTPQMTHDIFSINDDNKFISSSYFYMCQNVLNSVCEKIGVTEISLINAKFNMLFNNNSFEDEKYNTPHVDIISTNKNYSILYYVNDCDGDTIIFNESRKNNFTNLTVKHRIKPQKNKVVILKGDIFHASSNPRLCEKRIVMNINVISNEKDFT